MLKCEKFLEGIKPQRLFMNRKVAWLYTDGMPPEELMNKLQSRNDNQIMSLEVMAISLGLRTFAKELKGRRVLVYAQPSRKCMCMHFNVAGKQ